MRFPAEYEQQTALSGPYSLHFAKHDLLFVGHGYCRLFRPQMLAEVFLQMAKLRGSEVSSADSTCLVAVQSLRAGTVTAVYKTNRKFIKNRF